MSEQQQDPNANNDEEDMVTRSVACSILQFLNDEMTTPVISQPEGKESLEVAMQCLETAFGVRMNDPNFVKPNKSLVELVREREAEVESKGEGEVNATASSSSTSTQTSAASVSSSAGSTAEASTQGPPRPALPFAGVQYIATGPEYVRPPLASEEDKILADEAKNKGNDAMRDSNIVDAVEFYSKAIELDGNNATIFCNRAAAYIKVEDFEKAIRDCQIALQLSPDYARAYGRMGIAYATNGKHMDALLCFNKALEFDPGNETYQRNIRISTEMVLQDLPTAHEQFNASSNVPAILANAGQIFNQIAGSFSQIPNMQEAVTRVASALRSSLQQRGGSVGGATLNDLSQVGMAVAEMLANRNENANPTSSADNANVSGSPANNTDSQDQVQNRPTSGVSEDNDTTVADPGTENGECTAPTDSPTTHSADS